MPDLTSYQNQDPNLREYADPEALSALIKSMIRGAAEALSSGFFGEFKDALNQQLMIYPKMTEQDLKKLCFQSLFGGGHLISDEAESLARLKAEWSGVLHDGLSHAPFSTEPIGGGHCRFPLCAIRDEKNAAYALTALNRLFIRSAEITRKRNGEQLCPSIPPFRHSAAFRAAYHPAYCVLRQELEALFPLFSKIEQLRSGQPLTVLAIDGSCGSGKTSLAAFLQSVYGCSIIHADDFFLPPELRTDDRYAEPGGNIHYERFLSEVVESLCAYKKESRTAHAPSILSYRRFSCSDMAYQAEPVQVPLTPLVVVEGSYCLRPEFRAAYDISVFLSCSEQIQRERILRRNGPEMLRIFEKKWIPMENRYFEHYKIREQADFIFS